jgi:hypothetical protein
MAESFSELFIEEREDRYVLIRVDANRGRMEFPLSETDVLYLGRLASTAARGILASKLQAVSGAGLSASVVAPVTAVELNSDLHNSEVLLRIRDETGGEFDFALEPSGARRLGRRLMEWGDRVDNAEKPTLQ